MILFIIFSLLSVLNESLIPCMGIRYQILWSANRSTSTRQTCGMYPSLVDMWLDDNFARSWLFFTIHWIILPIYLCNSETEPIWLCVGGISDPPLTEYRICLIKYFNWGLFPGHENPLMGILTSCLATWKTSYISRLDDRLSLLVLKDR